MLRGSVEGSGFFGGLVGVWGLGLLSQFVELLVFFFFFFFFLGGGGVESSGASVAQPKLASHYLSLGNAL